MLCSKGRVGSNPTSGTKKAQVQRPALFPLDLLDSVALHDLIHSVTDAVNSQRVR